MLAASGNNPNELNQLRERVRDLEASLHQNDSDFALAFDLPPKLGDLLGLLYSLPVVSSEMIEQRLGIATYAKVAVYRLRKLVEKANLKIVGRRGSGYRLTEESKAIIRRKLAKPPQIVQPSEHTDGV
jgi:hypothetical protein